MNATHVQNIAIVILLGSPTRLDYVPLGSDALLAPLFLILQVVNALLDPTVNLAMHPRSVQLEPGVISQGYGWPHSAIPALQDNFAMDLG
jgi:hypothetical protein